MEDEIIVANLVACQMVSSPNVMANLDAAERVIAQYQAGDLVVLPECFACFGASDKHILSVAEEKSHGLIQARLSELAKQYGVWLIAGTVPIKTHDPQKYTASCLIYNDLGECVDEYQKIHLFDVQVQDNTRHYQESTYTQAGSRLVVIDSPFGKLGVAVCYDVRFPGMFQAMGQIDVLALPAAFTQITGEAHWHALLRARAIEQQCYVVAAGQGGIHENGRETYGHSCVISPWGTILDEIKKGEGGVSAHFDYTEMTRIRTSMPVSEHNKFRSYLV